MINISASSSFASFGFFFIRFRRHSSANQAIHSSTHPSISSASYSAIHFRRKWSGWEKRLQPASARYAIPLPELEYVVRPHEKGMISSFVDAEMRSRLSLGFVFGASGCASPFEMSTLKGAFLLKFYTIYTRLLRFQFTGHFLNLKSSVDA